MTDWKDMLAAMPTKELHKLSKLCRKEKELRWQEAKADQARVAGGYRAMANFMAAVTWAMACRTALRASKGHEPIFGKRPQSGEMWLPREILTAVRHQTRERGWHPITVETAGRVITELVGVARSKEARGWRGEHLGEAGPDAVNPRPDDKLQVARFVIPMVKTEARLRISDRFDYGGES